MVCFQQLFFKDGSLQALLLAFVMLQMMSPIATASAKEQQSALLSEDSTDTLTKGLNDFFQLLHRNRRQLSFRTAMNEPDKEGFTALEKEAILTILNEHRSKVSPRAADMIEVRWDDQIGEYAQNYANQCQARHQSNRNLGLWTNMGETIWWGQNRYSEKSAIDYWWNEVRGYDFQTKACSIKECGHYVTTAWSKTEFIGCGIKRCSSLPPLFDTPFFIVVCDYSAHFLSKTRPYTEGTSCSDCPSAYPKCRYNLCVTQAMLNNCQGYNGTTIYTGEVRENSVSDTMNCPDFIVDPVVAEATTKMTTPIEITQGTSASAGNQGSSTSAPANPNTTSDNGGMSTAIFSSLTMLLCLSVHFMKL